jgi:single-strand DNA-binding protein
MLGGKNGNIPEGSDDQHSGSQTYEEIPPDDNDPF